MIAVIWRFSYISAVAVGIANYSYAQICSVSTPFERTSDALQGERTAGLLNGLEDLDFTGKPYARLRVKTKYLNIRNAPRNGAIVGKSFLGQQLFLYAKDGDWLAVNAPYILTFNTNNIRYLNSENVKWIHKDYVSTFYSPKKISLTDLQSKCSFEEMYKWAVGARRSYQYCAYVKTHVTFNLVYGKRTEYSNGLYVWAKKENKLDALQKSAFRCGLK